MSDFKTYLFTYQYDCGTWVFEIKAASPEDAKARVARLMYAKYDGELIAKVPAEFGLLARLLTSVRNFIRYNLLPKS